MNGGSKKSALILVAITVTGAVETSAMMNAEVAKRLRRKVRFHGCFLLFTIFDERIMFKTFIMIRTNWQAMNMIKLMPALLLIRIQNVLLLPVQLVGLRCLIEIVVNVARIKWLLLLPWQSSSWTLASSQFLQSCSHNCEMVALGVVALASSDCSSFPNYLLFELS